MYNSKLNEFDSITSKCDRLTETNRQIHHHGVRSNVLLSISIKLQKKLNKTINLLDLMETYRIRN